MTRRSQLRTAPAERPNVEKLRAALDQRAEQWKADLRDEPQVARMLLRRLVGPITLCDPNDFSGFAEWEATVTSALLEGLTPIQVVASPPGIEPGSQP